MLSTEQWMLVVFVSLFMYALGWITLHFIQKHKRNKRIQAMAQDREERRRRLYENEKNSRHPD